MDIPVEVFSSATTLPKDPILRKQHLEELIAKIHGSFSFMQVDFGLQVCVCVYIYISNHSMKPWVCISLPVTEGLLSYSGLSPRW